MAEEKAPAKKVMGGKSKKKKSGKKLKGLHIRHATSGGYIMRHEPMQSPGQAMGPDEEHIVQGMPQLLQHVQDHMSEPPEQESQGAPSV